EGCGEGSGVVASGSRSGPCVGQTIQSTSATVSASIATFISSDRIIGSDSDSRPDASPVESLWVVRRLTPHGCLRTLAREVDRQPVHVLGGFHHAFRQGRVGMD